jgi:hypothetical protein
MNFSSFINYLNRIIEIFPLEFLRFSFIDKSLFSEILRDNTISDSFALFSELLIGDDKNIFWANLKTEFKKFRKCITESDFDKRIIRISR